MEIILRDVDYGPIYKQIEDEIKRNILSGELKAHDRVPSIRQFARDLRVSVITTKRAYEDLEAEGFLTAIPGKGYYVTQSSPTWAKMESNRRVLGRLAEAVDEAKALEMSREELEGLLRSLWEQED